MAKPPIMKCYVIGDSAEVAKTVTEYDVCAFTDIVGDFRGVHLAEEYAKNTRFKKRIAQGMVSVGLLSTVTGYMVAKAPEAQCPTDMASPSMPRAIYYEVMNQRAALPRPRATTT
ncbi:MaoC/PaaZ C-terminal domain-containing protein [Bradyrhizobium archetypum]|uniref:MaoC/PaaZ C-terminal domain-containing protein n=1 Tax=Bradyrhizobium archetypum TaxID=2721160 RepID=UPI001AEDCE9C|nr:MaoC/PaaZ C-terminal domain-containing protein [Bradyrhizobium archetypum]